MTPRQVMKVGYLEMLNSHLVAIRRAKNRSGEAALERACNVVTAMTPEELLARGKG